MESEVKAGCCQWPGSAHRPRNCTFAACRNADACQSTWADPMEKKKILEPTNKVDALFERVNAAQVALDDAAKPAGVLPDAAADRNEYPMADGLLYYFPAALAEIARVSKIGNDQHNPGEPMHWARGKSTDHANKIIRHLVDAGAIDKDNTRHTAKVAWRALALLQEELEAAGAPLARNARLINPTSTKETE